MRGGEAEQVLPSTPKGYSALKGSAAAYRPSLNAKPSPPAISHGSAHQGVALRYTSPAPRPAGSARAAGRQRVDDSSEQRQVGGAGGPLQDSSGTAASRFPAM
ncbi:unnamed protein product [Arctogadus glacialis]